MARFLVRHFSTSRPGAARSLEAVVGKKFRNLVGNAFDIKTKPNARYKIAY